MKKFTLLAVGESFRYQGEEYSKTGPLTASRSANGQSRMIPRHALVETVGEVTTPATPAETLPELAGAQVREAFESYHAGCLEWLRLAEQELSAETSMRIREALRQAEQRFLTELKL